jgi:hypothetical protein
MNDTVRMAPGADGNGLACMIADLLRENLQARPGKARDLRALARARARIGIVARDAEVSLTLDFADGAVTLRDGVAPGCALVVTTDAEKVTALSLLEVRYGLPVYFDEKGRAVLRDLVSGTLRIDGLLRHPLALVRLTRLLSVAG